MWGRRWLAQLEPHDPQPIEHALDAVHAAPAGQRIDDETARQALAASEVIAASAGQPSAALPSNAHRLATNCAARLIPLRARARAALERIREGRGPEDDPRDLYDEPDGATEQAEADAREWETRMDLLTLRLAD